MDLIMNLWEIRSDQCKASTDLLVYGKIEEEWSKTPRTLSMMKLLMEEKLKESDRSNIWLNKHSKVQELFVQLNGWLKMAGTMSLLKFPMKL